MKLSGVPICLYDGTAECSGRSPDSALEWLCSGRRWPGCLGVEFSARGLCLLFALSIFCFWFTKSARISEGQPTPLIGQKSKVKNFICWFIKCRILILWNGTTLLSGKLAIKKASSGLKIQYRLHHWLVLTLKAKIKKAARPFVISDFQHWNNLSLSLSSFFFFFSLVVGRVEQSRAGEYDFLWRAMKWKKCMFSTHWIPILIKKRLLSNKCRQSHLGWPNEPREVTFLI